MTLVSRLLALLVAPLLAFAAMANPAADYPNRMVRIVVPFPPGGATDTLTRLIAEKLSERWKQPVIVENKPGGNTMLGTDVVAKSQPDGHVIGVVTGSHIINPLISSSVPYDTFNDLTPVMLLTRFHMALYANPDFPANTPEELMALAKNSDNKLAYASATTQSYLGMELLNMMAGTEMEYVPYKGSAQALSDLIGGHVQLMIDPVLLNTLQHVEKGKIKMLGTMGAEPAQLVPDVPRFSQVVPGYDFSAAFGVITRAGTPPEVVRKIRDDIAAVMQLPEVAQRVKDIGQEAVASTPEEYEEYIRSETAKWKPVVEATGARID